MIVDLNSAHRARPQVHFTGGAQQLADGVEGAAAFARSSRNRRPGGYAFTLIELLVVVSIIVLLVAIMLPAMARAREQAKLVACESNLNQMGIGVHMYANDWRDAWPKWMTTTGQGAAGTQSSNNIWFNDAATLVSGWNGLGRLYPDYMNNGKAYYCPDDTLYTKFASYNFADIQNYLTKVVGAPKATVPCSYDTRGWNQPQNDTWGGNLPCGSEAAGPPGETLIELGNRAMASCFFLTRPLSKNPAGFHMLSAKYPTLFGDGHVDAVPCPSWFDMNNPITMSNSDTGGIGNQTQFWISLDKSGF